MTQAANIYDQALHDFYVLANDAHPQGLRYGEKAPIWLNMAVAKFLPTTPVESMLEPVVAEMVRLQREHEGFVPISEVLERLEKIEAALQRLSPRPAVDAKAEVAAERERCATIAELGDEGDWSRSSGNYDAQRGKDIARVIRGQTTVLDKLPEGWPTWGIQPPHAR